MRVLIVDDSSVIRERLAAMVGEIPGVNVIEARDPDEALAAARRDAPDVVLLDLHMAGKSGLAVLTALKVASPAPVVVVLTWHPTEHHRRLCFAKGADFFFDKSVDFSEVLHAVVGPTRDLNLSDARSLMSDAQKRASPTAQIGRVRHDAKYG